MSHTYTVDLIKDLADTNHTVQIVQTAQSERVPGLLNKRCIRSLEDTVYLRDCHVHSNTHWHVLLVRYPGLEGSGRRVITTERIGLIVNPGESGPSAIM